MTTTESQPTDVEDLARDVGDPAPPKSEQSPPAPPPAGPATAVPADQDIAERSDLEVAQQEDLAWLEPRRFEIPDELIEAFATGQVVVIAGAGVSTETPLIGPMTLFEQLGAELGIDPRTRSFPQVLSAYEERHGRAELLQSIGERLEYVRAVRELDDLATAFHHELSTMYTVDSIVTTNWDMSFEDVCGARPIVVAADYAFLDAPGRKVVKLHGSISNWGTIVATEADYERRYRRLGEGATGEQLMRFLAGKRLVFVGHSLTDEDFLSIYGLVHRHLAEIPRRSYIVTLDDRITSDTHPDAKVILTSGDRFLARIKEQFVAERYMLADDRYEAVAIELRHVARARAQLATINMRDHPEVIYAHSYQDGLLHAFERVLARFKTGEYSDPTRIEALIGAYEPIREAKMREGAYWDVAYINGYTNALAWLVSPEEDRAGLPMFFVFGEEALFTFEQYNGAASKAKRLHESAYGVAGRLATRYQDRATALHHTPWIG